MTSLDHTRQPHPDPANDHGGERDIESLSRLLELVASELRSGGLQMPGGRCQELSASADVLARAQPDAQAEQLRRMAQADAARIRAEARAVLEEAIESQARICEILDRLEQVLTQADQQGGFRAPSGDNSAEGAPERAWHSLSPRSIGAYLGLITAAPKPDEGHRVPPRLPWATPLAGSIVRGDGGKAAS